MEVAPDYEDPVMCEKKKSIVYSTRAQAIVIAAQLTDPRMLITYAIPTLGDTDVRAYHQDVSHLMSIAHTCTSNVHIKCRFGTFEGPPWHDARLRLGLRVLVSPSLTSCEAIASIRLVRDVNLR